MKQTAWAKKDDTKIATLSGNNLLYLMPGFWPEDRTTYGVTYHYDENTDSFQVNGTNTNVGFYSFLQAQDSFPYYVQPGETFFVEFSTTDPNIRFEVLWKVNEEFVYNSIYKDAVITIPENVTDIGFRLVVYAKVTINGIVKVRLTREIPQDTDILQYLGMFPANQDTVVNGVTWHYNSTAKTFTASGTATNYSFMNFLSLTSSVSTLIEKGTAYALKYSSTDTLIKVQFLYARDGQTTVYKDYSADSLIVIPEDVDAVGVRMLVYPNATVNGTAAVSLTKCELPEAASDDEVQVYTEFEFSPGWYTAYGSLNNNAEQTLIHTNPVRVIPGHDYYMSIKYDRGTAWPEGAFFDSEMRFIQALLPADLTTYAYQTPNGDAGSTMTNYVPLYKFTAPAQACYFSYNATNNAGFKYMTYIASIPVYRHIDTGDLVLKKGDPVRAYFGKRKLCVIGPSTVMIDRLYRTGNFENNGETQSQYVVGFQEYLMPYWADVVSYGYSSASYAKYDKTDGASADSIYTQIVTNQVDLSGYDDFLFVHSGNGFEREIGTVTSYSDLGNNTTYIGALRQIIDYIYQQNPQAKVYIQTMRRYSFQYASATNWTRADLLNDEIRKMAAFIACPVIDMDKDSGFNQYTATHWSYDATSLTVGGHWNHIGSREVALITRNAMIGGTGSQGPKGEAMGEVADLKSAINKYSTYPISSNFFSKTTGTHSGITYTWDANGECTVTGTSTSVSVNIMFANQTALPSGMEIGKQYIINYITSDPNVQFSIACYMSNGTIVYYSYNGKAMFTIPEGTVGLSIRLYVASGVSFTTPAIVSCVDIISVDSLYESFNSFKKAIAKYNSINLLASGTYVNGSSNGVTFKWNADMTVCTANGTNSSATASLDAIISGATQLPDGIVAGNDYYLKLKTSSPNLRIRIYFYKNGAYLSTLERNANAKISVPSDATGMSVFVCVPAGTSVSNATIEDIALLSSETNEVLTQNSLKAYEPVGSTFSVFADMPNNSYWIGDKSYIEDGITGDVVHLVAGWSYLVYKIKYFVFIVCPAIDQFYCGLIRVSDNYQFWSDLTEKTGDVYNNYYTTEHYDNTYDITCSPTITTDTNNYLASTGDTTDRTGDIQTMLNTTGVCHLGPGVFYVTGIDIPNLCMLIGSGNSTQVILAQSVTSGYAVKLRSYAQVKDVYIKGSASNITPTSTVGNRHGILFEGTANAENPTVYYRSKIDGCTITDFTGGGITCNNTGGHPGESLCVCNCHIARCGAGINLKFFTEFHRFTNISSQDNYYGCIDNGGNNNFANCDFSMNKIALLIDNGTGQSRNNTHGTFSACTFQHSDNTYSGSSIASVGTAIRILNASAGEIFSGCQIGYGDIEIDQSTGIRFDGCNIISMVAMRITNSPLVAFSNCTFWDTNNNPLTESGNTTLKYDNCYTRLGDVFDPMQ